MKKLKKYQDGEPVKPLLGYNSSDILNLPGVLNLKNLQIKDAASQLRLESENNAKLSKRPVVKQGRKSTPKDEALRLKLNQQYSNNQGGYLDENGNYQEGILNVAADSRVANNAWDNIVEPMITAEMVMSGAGLVNKGLQQGVKQLPKVSKLIKNQIKSKQNSKIQPNFKSEIDWNKWNKQIPNNKVLVEEYNTVDYKKNPLSDKEKEMYQWFGEQMRFDKLPQTTNKQSIEVLDNFKQRIRTPEGQKRLKELGITEEQLLQDLKIVEDPNTYGYYWGAKNTIAINPNHHPLSKKVVRHEIEHGVQNALRQSKINKVIDGTPAEKLKALESSTTEIDDILSGLTLRREGTPNKVWNKLSTDKEVDINNYKSLISNKQNATDYFLTGSDGAEKSAFLGEVQQYMIDTGKIPKNSYVQVTPEMVQETMIDAMFDEVGGGKYLRLFNIIKAAPKNYDIIAKGLNKILSVTPLLGAEALRPKALQQKQNGGNISQRGYLTNSPDRFNPYNIIPSNLLTMDGVPHDVLAIADNGKTKLMKKESGLHKFIGANSVLEIPIKNNKKKSGGNINEFNLPQELMLQLGGMVYNDLKQMQLGGVNWNYINNAVNSLKQENVVGEGQYKGNVQQPNNTNFNMLPSTLIGAMSFMSNNLQEKPDYKLYNQSVNRGTTDAAFNTNNPIFSRGYTDINSGMVAPNQKVVNQYSNIPANQYYGVPMAQDGMLFGISPSMTNELPVMDTSIPTGMYEANTSVLKTNESSTPSSTKIDNNDFFTYMSHQQGIGGIKALKKSAETGQHWSNFYKGRENLDTNMASNITKNEFYKKYDVLNPKNFLEYWKGKFERKAKIYSNKQTPYDTYINQIAQNNGLNPAFVKTVIGIESDFNPNNETGSYKGLMQLNKKQMLEQGYNNPFDPIANLKVGINTLAKNKKSLSKVFKEGGEYELDDNEIQRLKDMGYQLEVY